MASVTKEMNLFKLIWSWIAILDGMTLDLGGKRAPGAPRRTRMMTQTAYCAGGRRHWGITEVFLGNIRCERFWRKSRESNWVSIDSLLGKWQDRMAVTLDLSQERKRWDFGCWESRIVCTSSCAVGAVGSWTQVFWTLLWWLWSERLEERRGGTQLEVVVTVS